MKTSIMTFVLFVTFILSFSESACADNVYRLRMFFGLSLPQGGAVSLADWQQFEKEKIAKAFEEGFNVVDSVGYYKGHLNGRKS